MPAHEYINQHQLRGLFAGDFVSEDGNGRELTIGEAKPEDWFDMDHYNALKDNIAEHGIQRPIKVIYGKYLNEGHHRAMAAKELGLSRIPIQNFDDPHDRDIYDSHEQSTSWKLYK